jgi:hypothetical protein
MCRPFEIIGLQRMLYRLIGEPVLLVPLTGPVVQGKFPIRMRLVQSLA